MLKESCKEVVKYFKKKGIGIWSTQTPYCWLTGGGLGVVSEDHEKTIPYAHRLNRFAFIYVNDFYLVVCKLNFLKK